MAGDFEGQLWQRLTDLRADRVRLVDLVHSLDEQSRFRINREVVRVTRQQVLETPSPLDPDLSVRWSKNYKVNLTDQQEAIDQLRAELECDFSAIQFSFSHTQCSIFMAQLCRARGVPVEEGARIARFCPNPLQRLDIPPHFTVNTLPYPQE